MLYSLRLVEDKGTIKHAVQLKVGLVLDKYEKAKKILDRFEKVGFIFGRKNPFFYRRLHDSLLPPPCVDEPTLKVFFFIPPLK